MKKLLRKWLGITDLVPEYEWGVHHDELYAMIKNLERSIETNYTHIEILRCVIEKLKETEEKK